jgi:hypothetical protein
MHFAEEMVRESTVVVETTEVCATDVADLEFLVARGTRRIGEGLQFPFAAFFLVFGGSNFVELVDCKAHATEISKH